MDKLILNSDLKVVIIEDDVVFTKILQQELHKLGYTDITSYIDGEYYFKNKPDDVDIMLLDYYLDGVNEKAMNGLEVLKKVKKQSSNTNVLMLSVNDDYQIAQDALLFGASEYIVKSKSAPIRLEMSLNSIKLSISQRRKIEADKKSMIITVIGFVIMLLLLVILNVSFPTLFS